ncbi:MAG TPA: HAD-IA family hydrolase [Stellaceae bacterium]|nr:HAD-IA family hydrolase [Stellaceae bacterium]
MASFPLLVCDLDGTLVDTLPDLAAALNRMLAARGLAALTPAEIRPMIGDGTPKLIERALGARGSAPEAGADEAFVADYTAHVAVESRPFPGLNATLGLLRDAGWHFAVCTNKSTTATQQLLAALDLVHWFDALGCGDSFAARKPDPAHLGGTIALAGGTREHAVMVGDHANDIAAGTALGIPTIFAAWGYGAPSMAAGASAVATRFAELAAVAPRLLG